MNKLLGKATSKLESLSLEAQSKLNAKLPSTSSAGAGAVTASAAPPISEPPSERHIYQHRLQRGVNLGSLFALETWLVPSLFAGVKNAASEMDLLQQLPSEEVKQRLERHWSGFVNEGDWKWMVEHGINTVRLPIGYVHYCAAKEPALLKGTEYEAYADVYKGAWQYVENVIGMAKQYGVGVLVDLHCAPGAQNADGHSGLSGGKVGFWDGSRAKWNQQRTVDILASLASCICVHDNVVGLELLNEPRNDDRLQVFYETSIRAIRTRGQDEAQLPLYIGDAWDANWYTCWAALRADFIVVDTHVYRCFTPSDHKLSARQHAATMSHDGAYAKHLSQLCAKSAKGAAQEGGSIIVGEWSAALHHTSLPNDAGAQLAARKEWAGKQLEAFSVHCAGSFFWTLKKEGPPDPAWGLYSAIEQDVLPASLGAPSPNATASNAEQVRQAAEEAFATHCSYWNARGGNKAEQWRFMDGYQQGWNDAVAFANVAQSSVGFKAQWCKTRMQAHLREKGGEEKRAWEFEVGMMQGLKGFEKARGA